MEGFRPIVDIEGGIAFRVARHHQPVGSLGLGQVQAVKLIASRIGRLGLALRFAGALLEERVFFQLLGNEAFNFEIAQRQQLDRLLKLGSHDQRLALAKIEARSQRHDRSAR